MQDVESNELHKFFDQTYQFLTRLTDHMHEEDDQPDVSFKEHSNQNLKEMIINLQKELSNKKIYPMYHKEFEINLVPLEKMHNIFKNIHDNDLSDKPIKNWPKMHRQLTKKLLEAISRELTKLSSYMIACLLKYSQKSHQEVISYDIENSTLSIGCKHHILLNNLQTIINNIIAYLDWLKLSTSQ